MHFDKNCLKILGKLRKVYETRENVFDKIRERLFFGKFSVSFRTILGKFENQQKTLGK